MLECVLQKWGVARARFLKLFAINFSVEHLRCQQIKCQRHEFLVFRIHFTLFLYLKSSVRAEEWHKKEILKLSVNERIEWGEKPNRKSSTNSWNKQIIVTFSIQNSKMSHYAKSMHLNIEQKVESGMYKVKKESSHHPTEKAIGSFYWAPRTSLFRVTNVNPYGKFISIETIRHQN